MKKKKRKTGQIQRLREILTIIIKYGYDFIAQAITKKQSSFFRKMLSIRINRKKRKIAGLKQSEKFRLMLEELGPAFVKMGQILSTRYDLFPPDYINELQKLQDEVPPEEITNVEEIFFHNTGKHFNEVFLQFNETPIAAASLSQVYEAYLKNGQKVVVKIKRPEVDFHINQDLMLVRNLVRIIESQIQSLKIYNLPKIINELIKNVKRELNFKNEMKNIERMQANFEDNHHIVFPLVYKEYTTKNIIVMDYIEGIKINNFERLDKDNYDRKVIARRGVQCILKQIFEFGFFHGDPHPGNIFILPENSIAFIDFGMMGAFSPKTKDLASRFLISFATIDSEEFLRVLHDLGCIREDVKVEQLQQEVEDLFSEYFYADLKDIDIAELFSRGMEVLLTYRIVMPSVFTLWFKAILTIQSIGSQLDPDFNINKEISPFVRRLIKERYSPRELVKKSYKIGKRYVHFYAELPDMMRDVLLQVKKGEMKMTLERDTMNEIYQAIFNVGLDISLGLITAALIVGSAMLIRLDNRLFQIAGFIGFAFSGVLGIILFFIFLFQRYRRKK